MSELEHQKEHFKNLVIVFTHYSINTFLLTDSHGNQNAVRGEKKQASSFKSHWKESLPECPGEGFSFPDPSKVCSLPSDGPGSHPLDIAGIFQLVPDGQPDC